MKNQEVLLCWGLGGGAHGPAGRACPDECVSVLFGQTVLIS